MSPGDAPPERMSALGARRAAPVVLTAIVGSAALLAGMLVLARFVLDPPPGPPVATRDVGSGEPFALAYASNGAEQRVFVDLDCDRCSLPIEGRLAATAGGREVASVEIDAGDDGPGTHRTLEQHLLTTVPARSAVPARALRSAVGDLSTPPFWAKLLGGEAG